MTADDLLAIAADLVQREAGRPRQASLKRAVSTAYYGLFHALAHECVAQTVGWRFRSGDYWETVTPIYRAIDHASARTLFNKLRGSADNDSLRKIARAFLDLQEERIRADYIPTPGFNRRDALQSIEQAEQAIALLRGLPDDTKRRLAVQLVTRQR